VNIKEDEVYNIEVYNYTYKELIMNLDGVIAEHLPEGKELKDFTGGYIQHLSNSNRLTMFFGTKPGTKNKSTVQVSLQDDEVDLVYLMLKAKMHEIKNSKLVKPRISMATRMLETKQKVVDEALAKEPIFPKST